jgi:hypothetical protein
MAQLLLLLQVWSLVIKTNNPIGPAIAALGRREREPTLDLDFAHVTLDVSVDGKSRPLALNGGDNVLDKVLEWCLANDADINGLPSVVDAIFELAPLQDAAQASATDTGPTGLNVLSRFPRALGTFANQRQSIFESMQKCHPARSNLVFRQQCPTKWAVTSLHISPFLDDNVELLCDAFKELHLDVVCGTLEWCLANVAGCKQRQHIVMSPFSYQAAAWPKELAQLGDFWVYQLEQLSRDKLREISQHPLANRTLMTHLILDYSYVNLRIMHHFGVQCAFLLPVGTSKSQRTRAASHIQASPTAMPAWDAIMFGSDFQQRAETFGQLRDNGLRARIFAQKWGMAKADILLNASVGVNIHGWPSRIVEVTRLMHYAVFGVPSISEDGIDHRLEQELSEAIIFVPQSQIVQVVTQLVQSPEAVLRDLRARALMVAEVRDQAALLTQTLVGVVPACLLEISKGN